MYVIIKFIKKRKSKNRLPVILLNCDNEVWEFNSEKEAQNYCDIFNVNSDSGHFYTVKKI